MDLGVEVARNGEIDQEQRAAFARRKRTLNHLARQRPARRARRGEHDVGARELVTDTVERQRRPAETRGQLLRAVRGPIRHERDLCTARDEVSNRELPDLAGADHNDLAPPQIAEDLLGQRGSCGRDRRGALPDRGLRARLLAGVQRLTEEPIEDRAGRPGRVRGPHLAEDLTLAGYE